MIIQTMPLNDAIQHTLQRAGLPTSVRSSRTISSDATQQVTEITLDDSLRLIAKSTQSSAADRLHAEADGLGALSQSGHLHIPKLHAICDADHHTVMLIDHIDRPQHGNPDDAWSSFGRNLALHHRATPPAPFGWSRDNYIGATPQHNTQTADWVEFNSHHRLGFQLTLARDQNLLNDHDADTIQRVIDNLSNLIPRNPSPALIHGDLWSGNALPALNPTLNPTANSSTIALIDPAVSVSDAWADIAMMQLFGPFPQPYLDAYMSTNDDHEQLETRIPVYQLYHILNHLNLFGGSYKHSALSLAQALLTM